MSDLRRDLSRDLRRALRNALRRAWCSGLRMINGRHSEIFRP